MVRLNGLEAAWAALAATLSIAGQAMAEEMQSFVSGEKPELIWALSVGEIDAEEDEIDGISVDPAGNTVITGVFRNRLALGDALMTSRGEGDIFLASIGPDGRYRWTRQIGAGGDDNAYDLTTDTRGNIYVSGWFSNEVDFGGTVLKSAGSVDAFVAKYGQDGNLIWARNFGGTSGDGGNEIAVLDNGEIVVSALTEGDFVIDGQTYAFGGGKRDSFVIRMSPEGSVRWVARAAGPGLERIRAMAIAQSGDVYVGFEFYGALDFGGRRLDSRGGWDGALARLTPEGEVAWVTQVGSPGKDNVRGVAAAPDGSVYAAGVFHRGAVIAGIDIPKLGAKGDDYVLKVSPDGQVLWLVTVATPGPGIGPEIVADARGVVISALMFGKATFRRNYDVVARLEPPTGLPTSYLAAFDPSGNPRFVYTPSPESGAAGAFGDVLSLSRDGRYLAQAIRYRGTMAIGGKRIATPSKKDSAVFLLRLNGS